MSNYFIGIDAGTSSTRVIIYNEYGEEMSSGKRDYDIIRIKPGFYEQKAERWFLDTIDSFKEALSNFKGNKLNIKGIGITHQRQTFVPIDKKGNCLRNGILWSDLRSTKEVEYAQEKLNNYEIYRLTGMPASVWTIYKVLWLKNNEPELFRNIYKILLVNDYIIYKLTDKIVATSGSAAGMGCLDIKHPTRWSDKLLNVLGVSKDILPDEIYKGGEILGYLKKEIADELGLSDYIPVVATAGDQPCGSLGAGCVRDGIAAIAGGTSCNLEIFSKKLPYSKNMNYFIEVSPADAYLPENSVISGVSALMNWFRNNFGYEIVQEAKNKKINAWDAIYDKALESNAGSSGLILIPYFTGAAAPYWDMSARGVLVGLAETTNKNDLIRSIFEGLAYESKKILELMEEDTGIKIKEIRMYGGASLSDTWNQIFSDVMGIPAFTTSTHETTALGAAICVAQGIGFYKTFEEAVENMVRVKKEYNPNEKNTKLYSKIYEEVYKNFYKLIQEKIKKLSLIINQG
ncbi:MAG: xylulokinase [Candidatus Humimicrobiaceae bacterium]